MNQNQTVTVHMTVLGWLFLLLVLYAWSKTQVGHAIIYYGLLLTLLFMVLRNSQPILSTFLKEG